MADKPHAAGWAPDAPTPAQLKEFFAQVGSGRITKERLQRLLRGDLSVWKTIKLGTGLRTADEFRAALQQNGCKVSDWASDILGKPAFTTASEETEVDLVVVSVAELGLKQGATRNQIYARAQGLGLALCPAEVGPQLRRQYTDQPEGEWLPIGMEPITDSDGNSLVFLVKRHEADLWLSAYCGDPDCFWVPGNQWLFVCSCK